MVSCEPSYDGGSTQQFHFRARLKDSSDGEVSLNARLPMFTLTNLPSGSTFEIIISSVNKIGSSEEVRLETTTLQGKEKGIHLVTLIFMVYFKKMQFEFLLSSRNSFNIYCSKIFWIVIYKYLTTVRFPIILIECMQNFSSFGQVIFELHVKRLAVMR